MKWGKSTWLAEDYPPIPYTWLWTFDSSGIQTCILCIGHWNWNSVLWNSFSLQVAMQCTTRTKTHETSLWSHACFSQSNSIQENWIIFLISQKYKISSSVCFVGSSPSPLNIFLSKRMTFFFFQTCVVIFSNSPPLCLFILVFSSVLGPENMICLSCAFITCGVWKTAFLLNWGKENCRGVVRNKSHSHEWYGVVTTAQIW